MPKAKYSPCIKVCTYDDEGYCLGCGRTAEEIRGWRDLTEDEQLDGIEMLRDRQSERANNARTPANNWLSALSKQAQERKE